MALLLSPYNSQSEMKYCRDSRTVTFTGENNFRYSVPSHEKILVQLYAYYVSLTLFNS